MFEDRRPEMPETDTPAARTGAILCQGTATLMQLGFAIAAFAGAPALKANIREIESDDRYGTLYFSLPVWGGILLAVGLFGGLSILRLAQRRPQARLICLSATMFQLVIAFFTLELFHAVALIVIVLLLSALYVLSYRVAV